MSENWPFNCWLGDGDDIVPWTLVGKHMTHDKGQQKVSEE
jgi:hypothetical protein